MTSLLSATVEPLSEPLSGLPSALLAGADADLDALADRLHDGVLQSLVVARYACDAVSRGADPGLARDAVQEALVALRREVWLLRPRGEQGLATALADLDVQLVAAGCPGLRLSVAPVLPTPAAAGVAYRLVQALAGETALDVRLGADAVLTIGAVPSDPGTWDLRARAVGAQLLSTTGSTLLQLPTEQDHP